MRIVEDTPTRFTVEAPRTLMALPLLSILVVMGAISIVVGLMEWSFMAILVGGIFAGVGIRGFFGASSSNVSLDARTGRFTLTWDRHSRSETREIPLTDLREISQWDDDGSHTLLFTLTNGQDIRFEDVYTSNPEVQLVAKQMMTWLRNYRKDLIAT